MCFCFHSQDSPILWKTEIRVSYRNKHWEEMQVGLNKNLTNCSIYSLPYIVFLSAFGTWRCPLLGLLLDVGAPGGCGSRALAGGFRLLKFRGHFQSGLEPFVGAGLVGCPGPGEVLTPQPHRYSCPALQPGSALLLTPKRELIVCLDSLHSPRTPYTGWASQASEGCCCLLCGPKLAERRGGRYLEVTGRYTHCGFLFRQSS